jgi:hypothetical protein
MITLMANLEAKLSLVDSTKCGALIAAGPLMPIATQMHAERPHTKLLTAPELGDWFNDDDAEAYPYNKTFEEAKNDPIMTFHTSGTSSGLFPYQTIAACN